MPKEGTKKQVEVFDKLTRYLKEKGYEYFGYDSPQDDCHKFGDEKIYCYVQFVSVRAWKNPPETVRVIVLENDRNKNVEEFKDGNNWFGAKSKQVFVIPGDEDSYSKALRLINTV